MVRWNVATAKWAEKDCGLRRGAATENEYGLLLKCGSARQHHVASSSLEEMRYDVMQKAENGKAIRADQSKRGFSLIETPCQTLVIDDCDGSLCA